MPLTTTITGLDFILLPAQDVKRAEQFYGEVLGLAVEAHWGEMGVEFGLGNDQTLALVNPALMEKPFVPVSSGVVALKVSDIEAAIQDLKARGVVFEGEVIDSGVCKMMPFSDPDGNQLMLHHRYAP